MVLEKGLRERLKRLTRPFHREVVRGMSEHNARFGWHEGNTVIRRFAEALVKMVREEQLFRVFGDDFVVCFDDQPAREAFLRAWQPLMIESVTATCRVVERTAFLEIL